MLHNFISTFCSIPCCFITEWMLRLKIEYLEHTSSLQFSQCFYQNCLPNCLIKILPYVVGHENKIMYNFVVQHINLSLIHISIYHKLDIQIEIKPRNFSDVLVLMCFSCEPPSMFYFQLQRRLNHKYINHNHELGNCFKLLKIILYQ